MKAEASDDYFGEELGLETNTLPHVLTRRTPSSSQASSAREEDRQQVKNAQRKKEKKNRSNAKMLRVQDRYPPAMIRAFP